MSWPFSGIRLLVQRSPSDSIFTSLNLVLIKDMVFAGEAEMSITEFLEETIALRGSNPATVRDLGQLKLQTLGRRWNAVISNALRVCRVSAEDPSRNANTRSATHADVQVGTEPSGREPIQAQGQASVCLRLLKTLLTGLLLIVFSSAVYH